MKTLLSIILLAILLNSCNDNYRELDTEVIRGVISAKEEGHTGRITTLPKFYVQSPKETITISIPFADENLFKVGDTVCVVVKTVEKIK